MSNVELINIGLDGFNKWDTWESLGLEYLCTVLNDKGIVTHIRSIGSKSMNEGIALILQERPVLVGFTLPCYYEEKLDCIGRRIKQELPSVHISLGNRFATDNADMLFASHTWVDSIMRGEGEETIVDLYNRLVNKESLSGCYGLYYRSKNGCIVKNKDRPLIDDLDKLPIVEHSMIEAENGHAWICSSRGCINDCSFCNSRCDRIQKGRILRYRSPENVVAEIEHLYHVKKCTNITFVDCSYEDPGHLGKERIKQIAELLIQRKIKVNYGVYFSAHNWQEGDENLLQLLYESGLTCAYIGFESGYEETLKLFNKRASVKDNERAIHLISKAGISIKYGFIMIHPYLTLEEFRANNDFLFRNNLAYALGSYFNQLYIMKGTPIYKKVEVDGLLNGSIDAELGAVGWEFAHEEAKTIYNMYLKLAEIPEINILKSSEWYFKLIDIRRFYSNACLTERQCHIHKQFISQLDNYMGKLNEVNYCLAKDLLHLAANQKQERRFSDIAKRYTNEAGILMHSIDGLILRYIYKMKKNTER